MAFNIGAVVAEITSDASKFERGLNEAEKKAQLFGNRISSVASGIQTAFAIAGTAAAGAMAFLGKKAIDDAAEYEQQVIALNTLLGDQAKAMEHIAVIRKDALKTPFDVAGLIKANQLLISAGIEAGQAEKDVLALGDAISANGKGAVELERIIVNMQQIKNVGKATEMDMKQFAFNGINMYQLLADSTGKTIEQLRDMDISYEMISAALAKASGEGGKYHDANVRQSASLQGLKSNLADTASQTLVNIANQTGLFEAIKKITLELTNWITVIGPQVVTTINSMVAAIQTATAFYNEHSAVINAIAAFIMAFFIPAIVATTVQMGINLAMSVYKTTAAIVQFGLDGWKVIQMLIVKSAQLAIATAAFILHTTVTIAQTVAQVALTAATWLFNAALAVLTSPIFLVVAAIVALIAIGVLLYKNWDVIKERAEAVWATVVSQWNLLIARLDSVKNQILEKIMWPFEEAKKRIEEAVKWIKDRLDFTQRHSPSVVDIVTRGVDKVNDALAGINWGVDVAPATAAAITNTATGPSLNNIVVSLDGAMVGDLGEAENLGERIGDSIIRRLQMNVRF